MINIDFSPIPGRSAGYWSLLGGLGLLAAAGLGASLYMEHHGHVVTGMTNQVVWGTPHVFAVFLIVAASGALNVASIASVFGKHEYKPLAPLSGVVSLALLAGGLMVLVLDLGRPDRLIVAMTTYNFRSIFAWNIYLYNGFFVIVGIYVWLMMERRMNQYKEPAGMVAFLWRLALTTGTGSIFGFLMAREAYDAAIMAPMFVVMSFAYGLAIYTLIVMAAYRWTGRALGGYVIMRLKNLLRVFVAAMLYFVVVMHLTNLYEAEHGGIESFLLADGGLYTRLFWIGQIGLGGLLPLALLYYGKTTNSRDAIVLSCLLIIVGGLCQMYVTIIGGQAYPMVLLPGMDTSSSFGDGSIADYMPSLPEVILGVGGMGAAMAIIALAIKLLPVLPDSLGDDDLHYRPSDLEQESH